jgi:hypothetical protein
VDQLTKQQSQPKTERPITKCPRKGDPKARDPELRVDCPNMVIPPTSGPKKTFCRRKCAAAQYRVDEAERLAQLKRKWWNNLPEAEKEKMRERSRNWPKNNPERATATNRAWRAALPPERIEILYQKTRDWRERQKADALEAKRLRNVEGLDLTTGLRASLTAHGQFDGTRPVELAIYLYPGSDDPFGAHKQLKRRQSVAIKDEIARVGKLSDDQRRAEKADLRARLDRELTAANKSA